MLLEQMAAVVAVGEVGLDGTLRHRSSLPTQKRVFEAVVSRSQELGGRTLSIHSRQAVGEVLGTLLKYRRFGTAVMHWFTGNATELRTAVALDCWFSIGPAAFASDSGRALAARLPSHRVVPESDGPFAELKGSPVPPWSQKITATYLAESWACSSEEASEILTENSRQLLSRMGLG
jgi:TatD DNase family protein